MTSIISSAFLLFLVFLCHWNPVCNGWLLKSPASCSIQECSKGTCVQLEDEAIRKCTGKQCNNKRAIDRYLYRVLRRDEDETKGLFAKNPNANKSIQSHVGCGSKKNYKSQYISTTANYNAAKAWARGRNKRVAVIDIRLLPSSTEIIDLTKANDTVLPGVLARNFAKKYAEVLIKGYVPPLAINHVLKTGGKPPNCGCKMRKLLNTLEKSDEK